MYRCVHVYIHVYTHCLPCNQFSISATCGQPLYPACDLNPSTRSHPTWLFFLPGAGSDITYQALLCEGCSSHPALCWLLQTLSDTSLISTLLCSCLNIHYYHWLEGPLLFRAATHSIFSILDMNRWTSQMTATNASSWIKAVPNWGMWEVIFHVFHFIEETEFGVRCGR